MPRTLSRAQAYDVLSSMAARNATSLFRTAVVLAFFVIMIQLAWRLGITGFQDVLFGTFSSRSRPWEPNPIGAKANIAGYRAMVEAAAEAIIH